MAEHKIFNTPNGNILIEVETASASSSGLSTTLEDTFQSIKSIALLTSNGVGDLPKANNPSEIEVTFSIQALDDGNVAIGSQNSGNFQVKLKWGGVGGEFGDVLELNN